MPGSDHVYRRAGRVLPIDPAGRLLLFGVDVTDPGHPFWFTVGGGAKPGESLVDAAARELREEVGIAVDAAALGDPVWRWTAEFDLGRGRRFRQEEEYFLLRVDSGAVSLDGVDHLERQTVMGHCWLSPAELEALAQPILAAELPTLMRRLTLPEHEACDCVTPDPPDSLENRPFMILLAQSRISFDENGTWRTELFRELEYADIHVDVSSAF